MSKKYISNKDESIRLFRNNFLEFFSRVHWSVPLFIYIPIIVWCAHSGRAAAGSPLVAAAAWFALGLLIWTLAEYSLHRFIFHLQPWNKASERLHYMMHGVHHDYPMDSRRLVMPPAAGIPLAAMFYALFAIIFGSHTRLIFAGFLSGYIIYDMMHYAIHHRTFRSRLWVRIRNHHIRHHFENAERAFGVSSPLWDYILGTTLPPKI